MSIQHETYRRRSRFLHLPRKSMECKESAEHNVLHGSRGSSRNYEEPSPLAVALDRYERKPQQSESCLLHQNEAGEIQMNNYKRTAQKDATNLAAAQSYKALV